ncbi:hypothetical protein ACFWY9_16240 [Amycolatopsis sp. NPDC059027]|uniref:hypothetical protein n=1 Tax=unclassified Amycolatopsis TaxID=2618356 RepID=UPI00366FD4B9
MNMALRGRCYERFADHAVSLGKRVRLRLVGYRRPVVDLARPGLIRSHELERCTATKFATSE